MTERLVQIVQQCLDLAKRKGADEAEAAVSDETGFGITVRNGDVETLEHHQEKGLAITVYKNKCSGTASASDLSASAIEAAVEKACTIAQYSGADEFSGIPDRENLAFDYPDLQLCHPWDITPAKAIESAIECERIALEQDKRITQAEGVDVSTYDSFHVFANSHGFIGHYPRTRHSMSCSLLAEADGVKQRDYEYTTSRRADDLDDVALIAKQAAAKTVSRLGAQKIKTQTCPVLFHFQMAKGLLGALMGAISGGSLYRRSTFLLDHLNKRVFPEFVHIYQQPHLMEASGSAPFDHEGVKTQRLEYIKEGILNSYVLGTYSARKLGMQTTGNSGGVFNLTIEPSEHNLQALMQQMGTGLLVTELMGQGVNIVTGDYSRGAFGYWIENGEVAYPVHEITIAGNLKDMFANLVAIANDVDTRGNVRTGSILLDQMTIAGQ